MIARGIAAVVMQVGDLARARTFYGETLGLPEVSATDRVVTYDVGPGPALLVRLVDVDPGPVHPTPRVWLTVSDARAEAEAFRAAGLRLIAEPWQTDDGAWVAEVNDAWGNIVGVTSRS